MSALRGEDDYTRELEYDRAQALWLAGLSDGSVVCMDDGRPGVTPHWAWIRLVTHIRQKRVRIRTLWLKFRENIQRNALPVDADGYFFSRSILQGFGGEAAHFFLIGHLVGDRLTVARWSVPELIQFGEEERSPASAGDCLIRNP